jgi:hypothetical protein
MQTKTHRGKTMPVINAVTAEIPLFHGQVLPRPDNYKISNSYYRKIYN